MLRTGWCRSKQARTSRRRTHDGDVSLDNGYAEALIIFGDRTIRGVGGGVCQVSTTLFRATFFAGLQNIVEPPENT